MFVGSLGPEETFLGIPFLLLIAYGLYRLPGHVIRRISRAWHEGAQDASLPARKATRAHRNIP